MLSLLDTRCALESLGRQQEPPSFPDEDPHPSPNKTLTSATPSSKQCLHHQLLREGSLGASAFARVFMPARRLFKSSLLRSQAVLRAVIASVPWY